MLFVCWKMKSFVIPFGEAVQLVLRKHRINPKLVVSMPTIVYKGNVGEECSPMTGCDSRHTCY